MPIEVGVDRAGHLEKDRDREPPRTREERRGEKKETAASGRESDARDERSGA
jgi:hypothetical protein